MPFLPVKSSYKYIPESKKEKKVAPHNLDKPVSPIILYYGVLNKQDFRYRNIKDQHLIQSTYISIRNFEIVWTTTYTVRVLKVDQKLESEGDHLMVSQ